MIPNEALSGQTKASCITIKVMDNKLSEVKFQSIKSTKLANVQLSSSYPFSLQVLLSSLLALEVFQ